MHKRVDGLISSDAYFFRGDFDQILRGVVLDYTPRATHISQRGGIHVEAGAGASFTTYSDGRDFKENN